MKLRDIVTPVTAIAGIGEATAKTLAKLNIFTVADLLEHYPRDWEDRTETVPIVAYAQKGKIHTAAKVVAHSYFGYGKMRTLKITIDDGTKVAHLICFNRPFLEKTFPTGSIISITGKFELKYGEVQSSSFEAEVLSKTGDLADYKNATLPDAKVFPVYSLTAGITQAQMRKIIQKALKLFSKAISDEIPNNLIEKYSLYSKSYAINAMHNPATLAETETAKKTLIFESLYLFQLQIITRYYERNGHLPQIEDISPEAQLDVKDDAQNKSQSSADFAKGLSPRQRQLFMRLPFSLTADQMKAITEINLDIDRRYTKNANTSDCIMSRLLQGDVGSGKTLVAFFACLRQIDYGGQCVILAPTELLAKQHADNAANLLEAAANVHLAFLTGNTKEKGRKALLAALKNGEIDIIIGTHAVFSQSVVYKALRLVVIDEQHRFGVIQRNAIIEKGRTSVEGALPSLLMMSATPIPRTLALTVYGDLDISSIRTMPSGRLPIKTHLIKHGDEHLCYEAVRDEIKKGHQAYFVYPLIEQNDEGPVLKSAEQMYEFLSNQVYPEFKLALVHSQIDETEQHEILSKFRDGSIDILVATSVVEVGVDVPNATCMVIEHAERFGLAALHQLRGRVGRGKSQSHCVLMYSDKLTEIAKKRLKALYESTDGFYIAEQDMILRGPGEVNGIQQSGYLTLGIADPVRDKDLLLITREEAIREIQARITRINS